MHRKKFMKAKHRKTWACWAAPDGSFHDRDMEQNILDVATNIVSDNLFYYDEDWLLLYFENSKDLLTFQLSV